MRKLLPFVCLIGLAMPSLAAAQVIYVAPPPMPVPPPPPQVYVPAPPPLGSVPPHVYIRERIRWHLRRHLPRVVIVTPPAVVVEPPAPPAVIVEPPQPNVYVAPLPPVPPPIVAPAPRVYVYAAPPPPPRVEVVVERPAPKPPAQWTSKIGLGVRGTGQVIDNGWDNLGIGGEFLYRASPHLVTELAAEYQRSPDGPLDRTDIPITIGLRLHIGRPNWVVSPYFVVAAGVDIALQDLKFADDTAYYFDAQLGGGLELRLGQHFAITADARFDGKKRLNDPDTAVAQTRSINGKAFHPLADEYGGQFRLGVAAYF
jgi:hypothetical protein